MIFNMKKWGVEKHLKVSLDSESKALLKEMNDNLEALIIQTKENNRLTTEFLDIYQTLLDKAHG